MKPLHDSARPAELAKRLNLIAAHLGLLDEPEAAPALAAATPEPDPVAEYRDQIPTPSGESPEWLLSTNKSHVRKPGTFENIPVAQAPQEAIDYLTVVGRLP